MLANSERKSRMEFVRDEQGDQAREKTLDAARVTKE
jgi:hypothetical protein